MDEEASETHATNEEMKNDNTINVAIDKKTNKQGAPHYNATNAEKTVPPGKNPTTSATQGKTNEFHIRLPQSCLFLSIDPMYHVCTIINAKASKGALHCSGKMKRQLEDNPTIPAIQGICKC